MSRFGTVAKQYFDASGDPLAGGKLTFFEPGTTTPKTVYSDSAESVSIAQPVTLDASGYQPDVFFSGQAKVVLTDADDVQIDVADPVGDEPAERFPLWSSSSSYSEGTVVQGSDSLFYQSIGDSNQGNNPVSTSGFWIALDMFRSYSASSTYNEGMIVYYLGALYYCESDGTTAVTPSAAASEWSLLYDSVDLSQTTLTGTLAEFNTALSDGTFASLAGTETLTNKTISAASNTLTGVVTLAGAETLTNKTISAASNTLTGVVTLAGAEVLTNKTISAASNTLTGVATLTGTESLSNKTLESPTINGAPTSESFTITDGASVTIDAANGYRQTWALGADRTVTVSLSDGEAVRLRITGGNTWEITTWTGVDEWIGGVAPGLSATCFIYLWCEGVTTYGARIGDAS